MIRRYSREGGGRGTASVRDGCGSDKGGRKAHEPVNKDKLLDIML